jgi:hypothetical protein
VTCYFCWDLRRNISFDTLQLEFRPTFPTLSHIYMLLICCNSVSVPFKYVLHHRTFKTRPTLLPTRYYSETLSLHCLSINVSEVPPRVSGACDVPTIPPPRIMLALHTLRSHLLHSTFCCQQIYHSYSDAMTKGFSTGVISAQNYSSH